MSAEFISFGKWVEQRRKHLGYSRKAMALQVGCSTVMLQKIERDERRPSIQLANLLAQHLQIPEAEQERFILRARGEYVPHFASPEILAQQETLSSNIPPHNLPYQSTPFVGRESELTTLHALLTQPTGRLISILGTGGMGKTRLAIAIAEKLLQSKDKALFPDGIFFVPLAPLNNPNQIAFAIAEATHFTLDSSGQQRRTAEQQVLDYLREKHILLILDNFEHLLKGVDYILDILKTASDIQLLVTTRERLRLREEQLFPIEGLNFPNRNMDNDTAERYTAVDLFVQAAQRIQPKFTISIDDLNHLTRICQLVQGMPLGLELAAGWVDILPLAEIVSEIERSNDFLGTELHNVPERQRSMRVVFEASWHRLTKDEQEIFLKLSVFRGGFTRQAGQAVAGLSLRALENLVNKSFLQYDRLQDRYQIHELLRQFGEEELANAGKKTAVRDLHSNYFCQLMGEQENKLKGTQQNIAFAEIETELANLENAWLWAVERKAWHDLYMAGHTLYWFCNILRRRLPNGVALMKSSFNHLEQINISEQSDKYCVWVFARILIWLARFYIFLGQKQQAEPLVKQSQSLLQNSILAKEDTNSDQAILLMAKTALLLPHHKDAIGFAQESLELAQISGNSLQEAEALRLFGDLYRAISKYEMAQQSFNQALSLHRSLNWKLPTIFLHFAWGRIARHMTDFQQSENHFKESMKLARLQGEPFAVANALSYLGYLDLDLGKFESSIDYLHQAIQLQREIGNLHKTSETMAALATAYTFSGQMVQAKKWLDESLILARSHPNTLPIIWATQARINIWMGKYEAAQKNINNINSVIDERETWKFWHVSPYGPEGWLALTQSNPTLARAKLQIVVDYNQLSNASETQEWASIFRATLCKALWSLGESTIARQQLLKALAVTVKFRAFISLLHVLPIMSLFLTADNDFNLKVKGIEVYTLVFNHPFIKCSPFFYDIVGKEVESVLAELPEEIVLSAKSRSKGLSYWETAEKLLEELTEQGWGNTTSEV